MGSTGTVIVIVIGFFLGAWILSVCFCPTCGPRYYGKSNTNGVITSFSADKCDATKERFIGDNKDGVPVFVLQPDC